MSDDPVLFSRYVILAQEKERLHAENAALHKRVERLATLAAVRGEHIEQLERALRAIRREAEHCGTEYPALAEQIFLAGALLAEKEQG